MRHGILIAGACAAVSAALAGCTQDTPVEPAPPPPSMTAAVSSAGTGNITDLGALGPGDGWATSINADGRIVGVSASTAFSWQSGTMTNITALGAGNFVGDINDAGRIVGWDPAFLWVDGQVTLLPTLPNACIDRSFARAVNTSGVIVGSTLNDVCETRAVRWVNNSPQDLGTMGTDYAQAWDVNDAGVVVGSGGTAEGESHAFRWDGTMHDLGVLPGANWSEAYGINASGQIVGRSLQTEGRGIDHAFLWSNGTMRDLGTLGGPTSRATAINDNGVVVGTSRTASGISQNPVYHAFFWQNGVMSDLGTLGGDETYAYGINVHGVVVGASNRTKDGDTRPVRWTIPTNDFWSERAAVPGTRRVNAVATAGGLVYSIGGVNGAGTTLRSVQAYDPATDTWSGRAPLPAARQAGNGAATLSGIIYVAGGRNTNKVLTRSLYAYNSSTDTWSAKADMPAAGGCGGSAAINGKVYVFSGCIPSAGPPVPAGLLYRYDPATNTWATLRPAPVAHEFPAVGTVGGKLYVAGGATAAGTPTNRLEVYDPATNTWATGPRMPSARVAPGAGVIAGKLYVLGGRNADGSFYRNEVEAYDPATNAWGTKAPMIAERADFGVGVVRNSLLYAVGGRYVRTLLVLNERYTP